MESPRPEAVSDREEGEIVEDEELEDVSDCSLTSAPLNPGKSVSCTENLNGVCLSKRSKRYLRDESIMYYRNQRRRAHYKKRNSQNGASKKSHSKRRASIIRIVSDSDDDMTDPRYAKQLREAICRESTHASTNNSLKTRLKALIDPHSDEEVDEQILRDLALLSTLKPMQSNGHENNNKSFNRCDLSDSIDPELQELRQEALKSVILKNHERRKRKADQISSDITNSERPAKDIDKENDQSFINNKKAKVDSVDNSTTETSDLPSLNKTRTELGSTETPDSLEDDADILRALVLASMSKNLSTSNKIETEVPYHLPKITVKPLIINLDSDSDTESTSPPKPNVKNTVTEFLKRQRAEVEANVKKKNTPISSFNKQSNLVNKSVMKLLPHAQQVEYEKLKQLLNARKRAKTRLNSHRTVLNNRREINTRIPNSTKKLPYYKTATSLRNNNRMLVNKSVTKEKPEKKTELTINHLQSTLDDLQVTKNGRLQMKGKYRPLGPLLNKINQASQERRQHEVRIKQLLQEIQIARTNLSNSHQNFTNLVHQLIKEKTSIDEGAYLPNVPVVKNPVTSGELENKVEDTKCVDVPKENPNKNVKVANVSVFVEGSLEENLPKYKSPLDYRDVTTNPELILCPYDILGVCKDKECTFVHCM